jgi:triacylglycerol lipase
MLWLFVVLLVVTALVALAIAFAITREGPAAPVEPLAPGEPAAPGEAVAPIESVAPTEPAIPAAPAGPPPYPIVLVHGFLGWGELQLFGRRYSYFRGVAEAMTDIGATVHIVTMPPVGSVEVRARALADAVLALEAPRVHLVAHSMGGIDARYAIARLGLTGRVASLVTIGTPHRGTPLARLGSLLPVAGLRRAVALAGFDAAAIDALTPERMTRFNEEVPDDPEVYYASVVASARWLRSNPALWTGHVLMGRSAGTSDGVVPIESQRWGEVISELDADHWAQIGWSYGLDVRALYRTIALRLREREPAVILTPWTDTAGAQPEGVEPRGAEASLLEAGDPQRTDAPGHVTP